MTGEVVPERQVWLDALFTWSYAHTRRRYVDFWLLVTGLGILLLAWPAQFFTELPLWGPGPHDGRAFFVAMASGAAIAVSSLVWTARTVYRPIIDHTRGRPVPPEAVWSAAVRGIPRAGIVCTVAFCLVGNVAVLAVIGPARGFGVAEYAGAWLVCSLITATAGFFFVLIWEVAFRPILRELQPQLADDGDARGRWLTLSRRSAIASASAMAYTGAAVGCLVAGTHTRAGALWVTVLATVGSSATFGGVLTALVSHSIFMRVSELKAALVRIGRREYDVRVAVRAGDELDEAAVSLNRMAERLHRDDLALHASRARLASIADAERQRMERDLRHGVLTRLALLGRGVRDIEDELQDRPELHRLCGEVRSSIADAVTEIRRLARGVYPAELTEAGLGAALTVAAERVALPTTFAVGDLGRVHPALESAVYFCCTEALQNAAKHAGEGVSVRLGLGVTGGRLAFEVSDDGRGLPEGASGRGLANMRDRIRAVGGDVQISTGPGRGTTVAGWVPSGYPAGHSGG